MLQLLGERSRGRHAALRRHALGPVHRRPCVRRQRGRHDTRGTHQLGLRTGPGHGLALAQAGEFVPALHQVVGGVQQLPQRTLADVAGVPGQLVFEDGDPRREQPLHGDHGLAGGDAAAGRTEVGRDRFQLLRAGVVGRVAEGAPVVLDDLHDLGQALLVGEGSDDVGDLVAVAPFHHHLHSQPLAREPFQQADVPGREADAVIGLEVEAPGVDRHHLPEQVRPGGPELDVERDRVVAKPGHRLLWIAVPVGAALFGLAEEQPVGEDHHLQVVLAAGLEELPPAPVDGRLTLARHVDVLRAQLGGLLDDPGPDRVAQLVRLALAVGEADRAIRVADAGQHHDQESQALLPVLLDVAPNLAR